MKKILWGKEAGKKIWEIEYTTKWPESLDLGPEVRSTYAFSTHQQMDYMSQ